MSNYTYRFRLYPNKEQRKYLNKSIGCVRFVYNHILYKTKTDYQTDHTSWNFYAYKKHLPNLKKEYSFLKEVNAQSLQSAVINLNRAFKAFFKGTSEFPKFKKKKRRNGTFAIPQHFHIQGNRVFIPKLKTGIKAGFHREVAGKIKSLAISRTPTDKYYLSVLVEKDMQKLLPSQSVCGIDVGIKSFAAIAAGSNNNIKTDKIDNPKHLSKSEKRLKRLQRQLDRKQHKRTKQDDTQASNNYIRFSRKVAKLHEKTACQRADFLHKLSKAVINENQVITVENLNVKGMLGNHHLAKAISDAGWSMFINMLQYKADWYDRELRKVDRFYPSSKTCSVCKYVNKSLTLKDREWVCPVCNTKHDRDINAAINLYKVGQELPEFTPAEKGTVDNRSLWLPKKHSFAETGSSSF